MDDTTIQDRRQGDAQIQCIQEDVRQLGQRLSEHIESEAPAIAAMKAGLERNTNMTAEIHKNTAAIVEAWSAITGGVKVLGWLGKIAKYVAYIFAMIAAGSGAWYAVTHWGSPPQVPVDIPK